MDERVEAILNGEDPRAVLEQTTPQPLPGRQANQLPNDETVVQFEGEEYRMTTDTVSVNFVDDRSEIGYTVDVQLSGPEASMDVTGQVAYLLTPDGQISEVITEQSTVDLRVDRQSVFSGQVQRTELFLMIPQDTFEEIIQRTKDQAPRALKNAVQNLRAATVDHFV